MMKKIWHKPTINKLNIQRATLSGTMAGVEMNNAGDKNKQPLVS